MYMVIRLFCPIFPDQSSAMAMPSVLGISDVLGHQGLHYMSDKVELMVSAA